MTLCIPAAGVVVDLPLELFPLRLLASINSLVQLLLRIPEVFLLLTLAIVRHSLDIFSRERFTNRQTSRVLSTPFLWHCGVAGSVRKGHCSVHDCLGCSE